MIPTGSKAVINCLKKAKQNGFLQLMNLELEEFPKEVLNFNTLDFSDQNWWNDTPLLKMDLTNNNIKYIPSKLFENENQITVIKMINNQLVQLPIEMFSLKSLKSIDFSKNKLKQIPLEIINCQSLIEIILQENQIQQAPQNLMLMQNLQSINLSNNQIEDFPNFSNLKQLIKIDLSMNKIKNINNQALFNLSSLQQLNLQKNQIIQIQQGAFQSLNSLVSLQMDQNKLQDFNEIPVSQVLDSITISFNQIQQIQGFSNIPNLTVLVINNNKLKQLDKSILILKNIKTLDLSNNDLQDIPNELGLLPQLVRINIEGNPLKSIRNNIKNGGAEVLKKYLKSRIVEDVTELEKSMNPKCQINQNIDFWEQVIRDFYQNGEFICRQKGLKDIGTKIFLNLPMLRVLDLQNNQIQEIPREIQNSRNTLVKLNLNENKIQNLPQEILALQNLIELELQSNQLEYFFDQYKINFPYLKLLNLSLNKFKQVPECIIQFVNLNVINLAYNQIMDIEVLFNSQLSNLEVIDVCNNKIENVSDQIAYTLPSLQHLNLENNNMSKISSILGFLPLRSLKIDGNPLKQIPRQVISKGTTSVLDYLKNKHPNQNPQGLAFQQKRQQQFISQRMEEEQDNFQETNLIQMQQYTPQQQIVQTIQQKIFRDPSEVQQEIDQITKQIKQYEQELSDNYSLNKFQQNQKKKEMQSLMMKRSQLINELKN